MQAAQVRMENLSPLAARLMELVGQRGQITVAEAAIALGGKTSRNTIKASLQSLVKRGWLAPGGKGRGSFYTRS